MKKYLGVVDLAGPGSFDGSGESADLSSMSLGAASGLELYRSDVDFTVVRNDATSLDLSGLPFDPVAGLFVLIEDTDSSGVFTAAYTPKTNVFAWSSGDQRVTVTGATFSASGSWNVNIWGPPRTISLPENAAMVLEQNQQRFGSDDAGVELLSVPQVFTDAWADMGSEISVFGFRTTAFFLKLTINSDSDLRFRVRGKHEGGGAGEFSFPIETAGTAVVNVEGRFWEFTQDANQSIIIPVTTDGAIPYLQCQVQRGVDGAGTDAQVDTAHYCRGV